jgi:L-asparaginase
MFGSFVAMALVAASVIASPHQIHKRKDPNTGLTWIYKDPKLPKVMQVEKRIHCPGLL